MTSPLSETLLRQPTTSDAADAAVCLPPTSRCVVAEESAKRATAVKKRPIPYPRKANRAAEHLLRKFRRGRTNSGVLNR